MAVGKSRCCLCGREFDGYGNSAWPVRPEGRCCDECNFNKVLPARMDALFPERKKEKGARK